MFFRKARPYVGGCQNSGHFLGTVNIKCPIIIGNQKGTIILTPTHVDSPRSPYRLLVANGGTDSLSVPHTPEPNQSPQS